MNIRKFRTLTIVGVVALWSTICGPLSHAALITTTVSSTFDTGLDGWRLVPANDTGFLRFSGTVGNPPGSALFTDGAGGANGTIRAPSKFLGDWSLVDDLQYEHKIIRLGGEPVTEEIFNVTISGAGGTAGFATDPNVVMPSTVDWVSILVPVDESSWNVRSGDWNSIIANVTRLDIEIEMVRNFNSPGSTRDQDAIDNIRLGAVPLPPAAWLFGSGLLGMIGVARRKKVA